MGINIHAGAHGRHLLLVARLLRLDAVLVTSGPVDDSWKETYDYMLANLFEWTKQHQEWALWRSYLEAIPVSPANVADVDLHVPDGTTLDASVLLFLKALDDSGAAAGLSGYLKNSVGNRAAIRKTWEMLLGRTPPDQETEFWNERTGRALSARQANLTSVHTGRIDYFTLLMLLTWSGEGRGLGLHLPYASAFRTYIRGGMQTLVPRTAVVLCGHSRDFGRHSATHRVYIDNPYCDVFIHTWSLKGPRSYTGEGAGHVFEPTDTALLQQTYAPVSMKVEDLEPMRPTFTILDDPLFFNMKQEKDNASFYVNAGLYSFWKASLLVKDYEQAHGFTYPIVLKMSFIYNIETFDYRAICDNVLGMHTPAPRPAPSPRPCHCCTPAPAQATHGPTDPPALSIDGQPPVAIYMQAGCSRCNTERSLPYLAGTKMHDKHMSDLGVLWMYGQRTAMLSAAELYLHAYAISESVKEENIRAYVNIAKMRRFREFVYVFGEEYVNKRIYEIDDLPMRVEGFYYDNLFRMFLGESFCVSSAAIRGSLARFDYDRYLVW